MNTRLISLILILLMRIPDLSGAVPSGESRIERYLFDQVIIKGTTNVNQFELSYREENYTPLPDTRGFQDKNLKIAIPARKIKAESKTMLDDFLDLINARQHPTINISMAENITGKLMNETDLKHEIRVTMNGITNTYTCTSEIEKPYQDQWRLNGEMDVLLTDFGIEPPRKFLGIVKVGNEVFISFKILFSTEKKETEN
ncbi:hypothetical protein [Gaoshiqia sp. Z1-71]|uniref:hypothetical protein n=1 Tax=Gaoshiqia hydrogeniformans TaxID=3290090 RepID=UPI003BF7926B